MIVLAIDNNIEPHIALTNPYKYAPGTILKANFSTTAFITIVNKPKVKNVIGREKIWSKGLIVKFKTPKITVKIIKEVKDVIEILFINKDTIYNDIELTTINKDNLFIL